VLLLVGPSNLAVVLLVQIILFQFGLGSNAHFIILELYAQGNILLTDSEYTVMTLLRSHRSLFDLCWFS
jgi:hypothetical protein